MSDSTETTRATATEVEITLGLLNAVMADSALTQRAASKHLGVALGLVNTYLKRCIRKGWIKVTHAPANRYLYYLTPHGFAEKSRLTREYLEQSFNFFRITRSECSDLLGQAHRRGWNRIVLYGISDLAEVARLCALGSPVEVIAVVHAGADQDTFCGVPVVERLNDATGVDAVLITAMDDPQGAYQAASRHLRIERILTPDFLGIYRGGDLPPAPGE